MKFSRSTLVAIALGGCSVDLGVPAGAYIPCTRDAECPADWVCDTGKSVCVPLGETLPVAPTVVVQAVGSESGRDQASVTMSLVAADNNGAPRGDDTIDLSLEYSVAGGAWHTATLAVSTPGQDLASSYDARDFVWDALADAQAADGELSTVAVDIDGDEATDLSVVSFVPAVNLRITPTDSTGLTGDAVASSSFALGNQPPTLEVSVEPRYAGDVTVVYDLFDEASDAARVQAQFRVGDASGWLSDWTEAATLGDFLVINLASAPQSLGGLRHLFVWTSRAPSVTDPSAAQGVGDSSFERVVMRLRAVDAPGGEEHFGAWVQTEVFELVNQTPPRFTSLRIPEAELRRSQGPLHLVYRLVDEESDPADVQFEYSVDLGETWRLAAELAIPLSEGSYDLATAPASVSGLGGVGHVFVWDTTGISVTAVESVFLRATAADDSGRSFFGPISLAQPTGPDASIEPSAWDCGGRAQADCSGACLWVTDRCEPPGWSVGVAGEQPVALLLADLNGDGLFDLVTANQNTESVSVLLATGVGSFAAAIPYATGANSHPHRVAARDLDGDGAVDLVVASGEQGGHLGDVYVLMGERDAGGPFGTFEPPLSLGAGPDARALSFAEHTGDGIVDLVVPNRAGNELLLLAGASVGTFAAAVTIPLPSTPEPDAGSTHTPSDVLAQDFDGDGILDLAVSRTFSHDVVLLAGGGSGGVGDGSFTEAASVPVSEWPSSLRAGDFDSDGDPDLAVVCSLFGELWILENTGDFSFAVSQRIEVTGNPQSLELGDFNGDGVLDIAAANPDQDEVVVALGDGLGGAGNGRFGSVSAAQVCDLPDGVAIADWDGDGLDDLAVVCKQAGVVNTINGSPAPARPFTVPLQIDAAEGAGVVVGDIDWDGDQDLVAMHQHVRVHTGRSIGLAALGATDLNMELDLVGRRNAPLLVDVNGDDVADLVSCTMTPDGGTDELRLRLGVVDGSFPSTSFAAATSLLTGVVSDSPVLGDVNGDGASDLLVAVRPVDDNDAPFDEVRVFLQDTVNNTFVDSHTIAITNAHRDFGRSGDVLLVDVNGDGDLDVVVGEGRADQVGIVLGAGDGTFGAYSSLPFGASERTSAVAWGDFNLDGIGDLVVGGVYSDEVTVLLGGGAPGLPDGTFVASETHAVGEYPVALAVLDANGDGTDDVVVACADGGEVQLLLGAQTSSGVATGSFAGPVAVASGAYPAVLVPADFNGDGLLDVAVGHSSRASTTTGGVTLLVAQLGSSQRTSSRLLAQGLPRTWGYALSSDQVERVAGEQLTQLLVRRRARATGGARAFFEELRTQGVAPATGLVPATHVWQLAGAQRLARVIDPAPSTGAGDRLRVEPRFGERSATGFAGLDLEAPTPTGVVVSLPLLCRHEGSPTACDALAATDLRLFVRRSDWMRANAVACTASTPPPAGTPCTFGEPFDGCDPLGSVAYLPKRPTCTEESVVTYEHVVREVFAYHEIPADPDGDLSTGAGARFVVDASAHTIVVLTDELGWFQAFAQ